MTAMDEMGVGGRPERSLDHGYEVFTRERWAALARPSGAGLSPSAVRALVAMGEPISMEEVKDVYLPLMQLLILMAQNARDTGQTIDTFLGEDRVDAPFIIGIAGGVAVGKSTTARVLQVLLDTAEGDRTVELLTTDGFLWPNATLEARGIMERKGFPESYDTQRLVETVAAIRAGGKDVATPVYSHLSYDIVEGELRIIRQPDILIVEGLNVLQAVTTANSPTHSQVSDSFDVSIYVDASETDVAFWFRQRLLALVRAPTEPGSFFRGLTSLSDDEVTALADHVWEQVNLVNLRENVAPTRGRAHLIVEKGSNHLVDRVLLRRP